MVSKVSGSSFVQLVSSFQDVMKNYSSLLSDVGTSWRGTSYDSLVSKCGDFINSYVDTISSEMTAYANACELYVTYCANKTNLNNIINDYNTAVANNDGRTARSYTRTINQYKANLESLAKEINNYLSQAAATKLVAPSVTPSESSSAVAAPSTFTAGKALDMEPGVHLLEFTTSDGKKIQYNVIIPKNATEGMPVIMYLNGDLNTGHAKSLGYVEMAERVKAIYGDDAPFIVVQPVCNTSWKENGATNGLGEMITQIVKDVHGNPKKVIVTGASGGGIGSWQVVNSNPNLFSAFVPVSGDGRGVDLSNFTSVKVKAISSGDSSDSWNAPKMEEACNQINAQGGNATYETRPGYTHDTIIKGAYTQELFEWMIAQ